MNAAYSTEGAVHVKVAKLPPYTQRVSAGLVVVGFSGTRLFCMNSSSVGTGTGTHIIDVPPFAALYHFLDAKLFQDAYKCACLGIRSTSLLISFLSPFLSILAFQIYRT